MQLAPTQLSHLSIKPCFLDFWPLPSSRLCPSISTYNRPRPTSCYFLGLTSRFQTLLTAGPLLADQGLPSGHGSRCLFNFCPQHFKIISQDLDWSQKNMNIFRCSVTPILSSPPASGRQIMTPPESCLSIPHINFSYNPQLIVDCWLLSVGRLECIWRLQACWVTTKWLLNPWRGEWDWKLLPWST